MALNTQNPRSLKNRTIPPTPQCGQEQIDARPGISLHPFLDGNVSPASDHSGSDHEEAVKPLNSSVTECNDSRANDEEDDSVGISRDNSDGQERHTSKIDSSTITALMSQSWPKRRRP
ncbi:uncharacterized protein LOC143444910 [Clavelina lepadiformis]|uniref:uncharacterized protein LOC143444910 n=1 Tax=Clavelina lepadiformis TaxID=159417 RepID=UPI004042F801